ncbi:putative phage abortive infection protein [Flavobacterium luminosum]|uniref:Phage abortive infection protein n=1 Tax=Flavobacterium luminosum TaxID=2949086 RepID=A0ABT0TRB3_9FLAO|nr:putative phage abortive infection protein [Flavobacterium sp. HXWNR70]MCL9810038.1 putative phage abortive infection protein [Flavobacterium sp. HXWNR70]
MIKEISKEKEAIKFGTRLSVLYIILGVIGFVLIMLPMIFYSSDKLDNIGIVGDTVGGILNPIFAVPATILTFLAFWVQFKANQEVQNQFKIQQFESQFYEMIRLHRANIDEMDIASKIHGRKCFVRMFQEFKFIYLKLFEIYNSNDVYKNNLEKKDLCEITYFVFFFGVGLNSDDVVIKLIKPSQERITKDLIDNLILIKQEWKESLYKTKYFEKYKREYNNLIFIRNENGVNYEFKITYTPFDGHNTRLGHYYRNLYQTVSFVVNSTIMKDSNEQKKYLKLLRAQLSNHEQLLLYYNSLTNFGKGWIDNEYFTTYEMIKNIPLKLADFGLKPKEYLKDKKGFNDTIFEWDEL